MEVVDDALLRACDLHRLHGAEDLAKRTGDAAGRDPARDARLLQAPRDDLRHGDDRDERHEHEDRDRRVDAREDPHRRGREDREADHVDGPVAAVLGVLDVVAEDAHRFTGRAVERARTRAPQDLGEHVPLQDRADAEAEEHVDAHARGFRDRARDAGPDERR